MATSAGYATFPEAFGLFIPVSWYLTWGLTGLPHFFIHLSYFDALLPYPDWILFNGVDMRTSLGLLPIFVMIWKQHLKQKRERFMTPLGLETAKYIAVSYG